MNLQHEYDRDFHGWIQQHIALLKQGRIAEIDVDNLIEELERVVNKLTRLIRERNG
ncbi:MAG: DUF29 domain-containing protein [Syntrophales bacterium]|nr:DUF29 domain-containing protein [Syntrophales bacterium]